MKKNVSKLVFSSLMLLLSVGIAAGSSLAWFTNYDGAHDLGFKILQIDSEVRLYLANDLNCNGVPDLLSEENSNKYYNDYAEINEKGEIINDSYQTYVGYTNQYYSEKFDFTLKDTRIALSSESVANHFTEIALSNIAPSKIYTFKFELTNYVGAENTLDFEFDSEYEGSLSNLSKFKARVATLDSVDGSAVSYNFTEWNSFTDGSAYSGLELINDVRIAGTNEYTGLSGRKDFWLQIKMDDEATNLTLNNFKLPDFKITFTFDYNNA